MIIFILFFFFKNFFSLFKKIEKKHGKILFIGTNIFINKKLYYILKKKKFSYIKENSFFFIFLSQNLNFFKIRLSIFKKYKNLNENFLFNKENFINSLENVFSFYEKPFLIIFLDVPLNNIFLRDFKKLNIPIASFLSFNRGFNLNLIDYYIPLNLNFTSFLKIIFLFDYNN